MIVVLWKDHLTLLNVLINKTSHYFSSQEGCANFCTRSLINSFALYHAYARNLFSLLKQSNMLSHITSLMKHITWKWDTPTSCHSWHMVREVVEREKKRDVIAVMKRTDQTMAPHSRHLLCTVKLAVDELESHYGDANMTTARTTQLSSALLYLVIRHKTSFHTLNRSLCRAR